MGRAGGLLSRERTPLVSDRLSRTWWPTPSSSARAPSATLCPPAAWCRPALLRAAPACWEGRVALPACSGRVPPLVPFACAPSQDRVGGVTLLDVLLSQSWDDVLSDNIVVVGEDDERAELEPADWQKPLSAGEKAESGNRGGSGARAQGSTTLELGASASPSTSNSSGSSSPPGQIPSTWGVAWHAACSREDASSLSFPGAAQRCAQRIYRPALPTPI